MKPNCKGCVHSREGFGVLYCSHPDGRSFDRARGVLDTYTYDYWHGATNHTHLKLCDNREWFEDKAKPRKPWWLLWRTV